jgi:hypothetical protein
MVSHVALKSCRVIATVRMKTAPKKHKNEAAAAMLVTSIFLV